MRFATTLRKSLLALHPECEFFVLVPELTRSELKGRFEMATVTLEDLQLPGLDDMRIYYDKFSFCNNLKPFLLDLLLSRGYDKVVYLDSDTFVVGRFDELVRELDRCSFVLTPHWTDPAVSERADVPAEQIVELGVYNGGLLALRNDTSGRQVAKWLKQNLTATGLQFADQRFLSLAAQLFDRCFKSLTHPGYNIAYWNFHEREVSFADDRYVVRGKPVVFFHLSGFRPERPDLISTHGSRTTAGSAIKAQIVKDYMSVLAPVEAEDWEPWPERSGRRRLTPRMRSYYLKHRSLSGFRRSEIRKYLQRLKSAVLHFWLH